MSALFQSLFAAASAAGGGKADDDREQAGQGAEDDEEEELGDFMCWADKAIHIRLGAFLSRFGGHKPIHTHTHTHTHTLIHIHSHLRWLFKAAELRKEREEADPVCVSCVCLVCPWVSVCVRVCVSLCVCMYMAQSTLQIALHDPRPPDVSLLDASVSVSSFSNAAMCVS